MTSRLLSLFLLLLLAAPASAAVVSGPGDAWTAQLPAGFAAPPGAGTPRKARAWMKGDFSEGTAELLVVEPMGGTIGREPIDVTTVEDTTREAIEGSDFRITQTEVGVVPWRTHELQAVAVVVESPDESRVTVSTQVPLRPEALNVSITGPTRMGSQLQADLRAFVGSIDGPTNWVDRPETPSDEPNSAGPGDLLGAGGVALLGLVAVGVWFVRKRRDP